MSSTTREGDIEMEGGGGRDERSRSVGRRERRNVEGVRVEGRLAVVQGGVRRELRDGVVAELGGAG